MRLDKFLVAMQVATRKEAKQLIKQKRILINDELAKKAEQQIDPDHDRVLFDGELLVYKAYWYIMLHKPAGVISATEDNFQTTVLDLLDRKYAHVFPVGRLDKDTEGLLLLTNNGQLAHQLLSPKKHVIKQYEVHLENPITLEAIAQLEAGITLNDGYHCLPARVHTTADTNQVRIDIQEGKFHQVKRMFLACNNRVTYLKRLRMGPIELDSTLKLGEYRELSEDELALLASYL